MQETARIFPFLQQFHRFEFKHGPIDLMIDAADRYRFLHSCTILGGETKKEPNLYRDARSGEMNIARFGKNLASLSCPRCGTRWGFTWPSSEKPTFTELIKAVTEGKFPPNILASQ